MAALCDKVARCDIGHSSLVGRPDRNKGPIIRNELKRVAMKHFDSAKPRNNILLYLAALSMLVLIFTLKIYLPMSCARSDSNNGILAINTRTTTEQNRELRRFISWEIGDKHPSHNYSYKVINSNGFYACVRVHVGRSLSLIRTPDTDQGRSDYNENWAMVYFLGQWFKVGENEPE